MLTARPLSLCWMLFLSSDRVRAVVTMRSDFYHRAVDYQELAEILRDGSFPLAIPKRDALCQMIERPAERAGLTIEDGLVERMLDDTGHEPGNLALMAYALDELYKLSDGALTHEDYDKLGGVQGAIGTRAENQFKKLDVGDDVLQRVFHMLVEVDERGTATRRRATLTPDTLDDDAAKLIKTFTDERLLTTSYDNNTGKATVEVAHEAILRSWPRLAEWIEDTQDDLRSAAAGATGRAGVGRGRPPGLSALAAGTAGTRLRHDSPPSARPLASGTGIY